ncbi:MAG: hypothetical protein ABA06_00765 [Parcubacteria bacterium C7867-001]|nr:MAG: hypothetical protein ABA06_00765 [Parcubacteria bacterium C7867-001]
MARVTKSLLSEIEETAQELAVSKYRLFVLAEILEDRTGLKARQYLQDECEIERSDVFVLESRLLRLQRAAGIPPRIPEFVYGLGYVPLDRGE